MNFSRKRDRRATMNKYDGYCNIFLFATTGSMIKLWINKRSVFQKPIKNRFDYPSITHIFSKSILIIHYTVLHSILSVVCTLLEWKRSSANGCKCTRKKGNASTFRVVWEISRVHATYNSNLLFKWTRPSLVSLVKVRN